MNIILYDDPVVRLQLLPFTYTRPVADVRVGILKIFEKWQLATGHKVSFLTEDYLQGKFAPHYSHDNFYINGALCPTEQLIAAILDLHDGQSLWIGGVRAAFRTLQPVTFSDLAQADPDQGRQFDGAVNHIDQVWKIFQLNGDEIRADYELLTAGRVSEDIQDPYTRTYNPENIFVEEGVRIKSAILNAENGPIYLGKGAEVMEGAMIRGPFAMGESSVVGMGAKIRGDTSLGPYCKVAGEVSNSVLFGNSNKGHDGYLGNAVLGEWCNLGADTNASNLKNNYANVKVWSFSEEKFVDTGLQFCGLIMGDHSKCGINTMFNTGTVVGVCANIFGDGFPRTFIPSFAWGGAAGFTTYKIDQALDTVEKVLKRRGRDLGSIEREMLVEVFNRSGKFRTWENKT